MISRYRKDIDGLRAIAVGGVVAFHAFPQLLTGGFIGVDVFFVISGYLITSTIVADTRAGRFSIAGFYERRFRRILPALFVVLLATTAACVLILPPSELDGYGRSLLAVCAFASNVLFWFDGGYFDGPAAAKPLLHTWSLSVEEQFYVVWPLLIMWLTRLGQFRLLRHAVWAIVIASLIGSEIVVQARPTQAFYLIPWRAWELSLGALLAIGALPASRTVWVREASGLAGLAMIVVPMLVYTEQTPFPGLTALPPCLGTLLIIHSGESGETKVSRLFTWPAMLRVGTASYSFYLWHWPILVLAQIACNRPLTPLEAVLCVVLAFVLALLSLRFVEQPFRRRDGVVAGRRQLLTASAAVLAAVGLSGAATAKMNGFSAYASRPVALAEKAVDSINPLRARCHNDGQSNDVGDPAGCIGGDIGSTAPGAYDILLWGDSHADHLMPGVSRLAKDAGLRARQATVSGCSPLALLGLSGSAARPGCVGYHRAVLAEAAGQPNLRLVIVSARWSSALTSIEKSLADPAGGGGGAPHAQLGRRIGELTGMIRARIGRPVRIVFVGSTPEFDYWPAVCAARRAHLGWSGRDCGLSAASDDASSARTDAVLRAVGQAGAVAAVFPRGRFCDDRACRTIAGGTILFRDDDHLTNEGSTVAAATLAPWISAVARTRAP